MKIIAIDPGSEKSAYVYYENGNIILHGILENEDMIEQLGTDIYSDEDELVIEMIASYGMPVGKSVFETCVWIGRFIQAWRPMPAHKIYRSEVKIYLCNSMRAKDGNIRQALIDRYPATGGGKCPQIGTKKEPGPLYGVSKDIWSALAMAVTFDENIHNATGAKR